MPPAQPSDLPVHEVGFSPNPGDLKMFLARPETLPAKAPLVVVLHGCGQRAVAFAQAAGWFGAASRFGLALLLPEQSQGNNLQRCFNWFRPEDAEGEGGEAASIREMILTALATGLDPDRVYIVGLSAGGGMAAALLALYPDLFAGGAVIAGPPFAAARTLREALGVMNGSELPSDAALRARRTGAAGSRRGRPVKLSLWHGLADTVVSPSSGEALAAQFRPSDATPQTERLEGVRLRKAWRDDAGSEVELNLIRGLKHGVPLAASELGHPAPFVLEVGVSSTLEILRFWGLAPAEAEAAPARSDRPGRPAEPKLPRLPGFPRPAEGAGRPGGGLRVEAIIRRSLKAAGLLR